MRLYRYTGLGGLSSLIVVFAPFILLGALDGITRSGWVWAFALPGSFLLTGWLNYILGRALNRSRVPGQRAEHTFNGFPMEETSVFSVLLAIIATAAVIGHVAGAGLGWLAFAVLTLGSLGLGLLRLVRQGGTSAKTRDDAALARLAEARGWTLKPLERSAAWRTRLASGSPVGKVAGSVDGRPFVVHCYARWTQFIMRLSAQDLPEVNITIDPSSGQPRYTGDVGFGRTLVTPQALAAAAGAGITEFLVHRGMLCHHRQTLLTAPQIDEVLRALADLAAAFRVGTAQDHG